MSRVGGVADPGVQRLRNRWCLVTREALYESSGSMRAQREFGADLALCGNVANTTIFALNRRVWRVRRP
jgi:hypothetical protein